MKTVIMTTQFDKKAGTKGLHGTIYLTQISQVERPSFCPNTDYGLAVVTSLTIKIFRGISTLFTLLN